MTIVIKEINADNLELVKALSVHEEQQTFIETVADCLAEADEVKEWHPVAIYDEEEVVGFAMYGSFGPNKDTWIDRILIDKKYQGRGFGAAAMKQLIQIVMHEYNVDKIYLSIIKENKSAPKFYKNLGFEDMNEIDPSNGELMFCYRKHK